MDVIEKNYLVIAVVIGLIARFVVDMSIFNSLLVMASTLAIFGLTEIIEFLKTKNLLMIISIAVAATIMIYGGNIINNLEKFANSRTFVEFGNATYITPNGEYDNKIKELATVVGNSPYQFFAVGAHLKTREGTKYLTWSNGRSIKVYDNNVIIFDSISISKRFYIFGQPYLVAKGFGVKATWPIGHPEDGNLVTLNPRNVVESMKAF